MKKSDLPKRASIYVRVSTERQADKVSPATQEADCRKYCEERGYIVIAVYRDTEKYRVGKRLVEPSGTRGDRPGLRRMLADGAAGMFDVIVAWREDRLYRGVNRAMLDLSELVKDGHVTIELAKEFYDPQTAIVKAWAAGIELQAKHDRMVMGVAGRLAKGKTPITQAPYGYAKQDTRFVISPAEAEAVRLIWKLYGEYSTIRDIRRQLIAQDAPQRNPKKYPWHNNVITHLLRHDFYYTGIYHITWDGQTYDLPIPVIIDTDTARRVKERKAKYQAYPAGNFTAQALGAGLIYCQACDIRMMIQTANSKGHQYLYYTCPNHKQGLAFPGCAGRVRIEPSDGQLWDKTWRAITEPDFFDKAIAKRVEKLQAQEQDAKVVCQQLREQLDTLTLERQKIITHWRKGGLRDEDLDYQLAAMSIQESGIRRQLAEQSLLVDNHLDRLLELARLYRERVMAGAALLTMIPQAEAERQAQFEFRRQAVLGVVKRATMACDKSIEVQIEIDLSELAGETQAVFVLERISQASVLPRRYTCIGLDLRFGRWSSKLVWDCLA